MCPLVQFAEAYQRNVNLLTCHTLELLFDCRSHMIYYLVCLSLHIGYKTKQCNFVSGTTKSFSVITLYLLYSSTVDPVVTTCLIVRSIYLFQE